MRGRNKVFSRRRLCSRNGPEHIISAVLGRGVLRVVRAEAARKCQVSADVDASLKRVCWLSLARAGPFLARSRAPCAAETNFTNGSWDLSSSAGLKHLVSVRRKEDER